MDRKVRRRLLERIVKENPGFCMEQRQVKLNTGRTDTVNVFMTDDAQEFHSTTLSACSLPCEIVYGLMHVCSSAVSLGAHARRIQGQQPQSTCNPLVDVLCVCACGCFSEPDACMQTRPVEALSIERIHQFDDDGAHNSAGSLVPSKISPLVPSHDTCLCAQGGDSSLSCTISPTRRS